MLRILFLGDYMQSKINALLNYCYTATNLANIEFQLFLLSVKCLMPYEDKIGCFFDVERYKMEIDLFTHYKNGEDIVIDHYIEHKTSTNIKDELLEYKIIPLILSNTVWDNLIEEVLKLVVFYSLNKDTILDAIYITSAIYEYMNNNRDNIDEITKDRLINFSMKDFLANNNINIDKDYLISFEKERIKRISKAQIFDDISNYNSLKYIFGEIEPKVQEKSQESLIDNFSAYLFKLRKGIIAPERLKVSAKMPKLSECLKQAFFNHPLLGRCKVIKRTKSEVIVRNKSGFMRMRMRI